MKTLSHLSSTLSLHRHKGAIMSNQSSAFRAIGVTLLRSRLEQILKKLNGCNMSEDEAFRIDSVLNESLLALIQLCRNHDLDEGGLDAVAGVYSESVTYNFVHAIGKIPAPKETRYEYGATWQLEFDPGPPADDLRTDEKGRVWRKIEADPFVDIRF